MIRGSHKLGPEVPISEVIDGALSDPALGLVSQVVNVPAGSTLIFFESLLHAGGTITSGRDRLLIIAGCPLPPPPAPPAHVVVCLLLASR